MPAAWLWHDLHIKLVDGSTLMAPDTDENQAEWPRASTQQPGLGNPILRFCVLMSLATGALCGFADAPYQGKETGEPALLRRMLDLLNEGDLLLGDAHGSRTAGAGQAARLSRQVGHAGHHADRRAGLFAGRPG